MALLFTRAANKALDAMPARERRQLLVRLHTIAAAPAARHAGVTAMRGGPSGRFRVRQGDWRAVFVVDAVGDVEVNRIGHRSEVYD